MVREILRAISVSDISHRAFPLLSTQMIMCDAAEVPAIQVSYAAELAYESYMPTYQLPSIYESIFRVGKEMGLRDFGGLASNRLAIENTYRALGHSSLKSLLLSKLGWLNAS